jgi:hypothetical protein
MASMCKVTCSCINKTLPQETQASCRSFERQVQRFGEMADLLCSMTEDAEGRRMVRLSFGQLDDLRTKLENAIEASAA